MKRRGLILSVTALAVAGIVSLNSFVFARSSTPVCSSNERTDCPGKITCPLTGEIICRDKCPTIDANRPDCPGRIVCPLTGKLVCKDRCPLGSKAAASAEPAAKPSCCQKNSSGG